MADDTANAISDCCSQQIEGLCKGVVVDSQYRFGGCLVGSRITILKKIAFVMM
jgi:hypothetical protein